MPILIGLRVILLRIIRVLVCATIESAILKTGLNLSPKLSVQYALALNLLASLFEWVVFLSSEFILPLEARKELIYYLLMEKMNETSPSIFLLTIFNFTALLFVKWIGLELFKILSIGENSTILKLLQEDLEQTLKGSEKKAEKYRNFRIISIAHTVSYALFLLWIFTLLIFEP